MTTFFTGFVIECVLFGTGGADGTGGTFGTFGTFGTDGRWGNCGTWGSGVCGTGD